MKRSPNYQAYLKRVRQRGYLEDEEVTRDEVNTWLKDDQRRGEILRAREAFLAVLPKPLEVEPPRAVEPPADSDPNTLAFTAKIIPALEIDIKSGCLYTEATLAAMNLPGWADAIARYARAAHDERHRQTVEQFFVELGKAVSSGRALWDKKDELIFCNYHATKTFKKPLSQMTEEEGSVQVGLSVAAFDKRLQRLGLKRKGGRPRKEDRSSRKRS